jgi:hypothetical protein
MLPSTKGVKFFYYFKCTQRTVFVTGSTHTGYVRLVVRLILIWYGPVCSKQTVRTVPLLHYGPYVHSSATNHVKKVRSWSKRLRHRPTIEWSDPNHTNKRMLLVCTDPDRSVPINEHTHYVADIYINICTYTCDICF